TSEKILPEENSSLSADLEDYIKMLTESLDDETAYWSAGISSLKLKQPGFQDLEQEE
ncbi:7908_t:CDS:2, partial [Funneliformis caledonium]